jgi:capsular exopolysaccharide synthesis family protein
MSRFYEFIQKLGNLPEYSEVVSPPTSERSHPSPDLQDIFAAIDTELPEALPIRSTEPSRSLESYPVVNVRVSPQVRLLAYTHPASPSADRYRFLGMRLASITAAKPKTLLISSPLSQDGKTTVALNLATTLTEKGKHSVLLIDADLHRASATNMLALEGRLGLSECVEGNLPLATAITLLDPLGWHFMPAGKPALHPTHLLQQDAFGHVFERLSSRFDWILIDSPPVLPVTDACLLSRHADGVLMVVRAGKTPAKAATEALKILGKKTVVGIVLNGGESPGKAYNHYGAYYRHAESESSNNHTHMDPFSTS